MSASDAITRLNLRRCAAVLLCLTCLHFHSLQSYSLITHSSAVGNARQSHYAVPGSESEPHSMGDMSRKWLGNACLALLPVLSYPLRSRAAKGAFEMDMEFYLQNLLGARKEKETQLFRQGTILPSPRMLDEKFAVSLFDTVLTVLAEFMHQPVATLRSNVQTTVPYALKYFQTFAPIQEASLRDQYYLDLSLWIAYRQAGEVVTDSPTRVRLRQRVGDAVLQLLVASGRLNMPKKPINDVEAVTLGRDTAISILNIFNSTRVIGGYILDDENLEDRDYIAASFRQGLPISFQITLQRPITLLSFIQQSAVNTFYHPDIVGTTLMSAWSALGLRARFEDYLMDNYFREENFDIQAQDVLLECLIEQNK